MFKTIIKNTSVATPPTFFTDKLEAQKKEIEDESGVSRNTVSTLIDKLEELGIIVADSTYAKLGYKYSEIYNVFVGKNMI